MTSPQMMDTSDEWIRQRSGISERRWVDGGVGSSDLASGGGAAGAGSAAGMEASDLDCLIVLATLSPGRLLPGIRCIPAAEAGGLGHPVPGREEPVLGVHLRSVYRGRLDP